MAGKIAILLCDHYLRETEAVLAPGDFEEVVFVSYPARCNRPPFSREELVGILLPFGDCERVEVFGSACCLAGIEDPPEGPPDVRLHRLPQCFSMIADQEIINRSILEGAYLVTPGWLADWSACVERMGIDRETAREMFRETTPLVILLETGIDPQSGFHLKEFAEFIARPYRILPVGLSALRLLITKTVLTWRMESEKRASAESAAEMQRQSADYAMAVDLLGNMARITEETEAVEAMLNVFTMLFAPGHIAFLNFRDAKPEKLYLYSRAAEVQDSEAIRTRLAGFREESAWTESGTGFLLRSTYRGETRGVIAIEEIAFPEYRDRYLNLALSIINVCALPIDNARKYDKLRKTEELLKKANTELHHLATTDTLTRIANRRSFDSTLAREWKRMMRSRTPLSLIMCDIDFFKSFNDLYGHQAGDACLHAVAQAIDKRVVRPGDFVARYGGEEFVAVLPVTPLEGARHIAEKIRRAVRKLTIPHAGSEVDPFVTLSLGVAQGNPSPQTKAEALLQAADVALYRAKNEGRNRIVLANTKDIEGA